MIDLRLGDCLDVMRTLDADSIDAIVTDPPAGISFMGKAWDGDKGGRDKWITWMSEIAAECLRVLKPGGYALVWSLPRTSHWTGMAWENGGFEPRDRLAYCFGSGFPKSMAIDKAIDRAAGVDREVIGKQKITGQALGQTKGLGLVNPNQEFKREWDITAPATNSAREWSGWGTALKPAIEDWWVFRKPLSEGTVAANCLRWGTGALNIDAGRVDMAGNDRADYEKKQRSFSGAENTPGYGGFIPTMPHERINQQGRFPANLITDGSDEVMAMFPQTNSGGALRVNKGGKSNSMAGYLGPSVGYREDDGGSASRFFAVCPLDDDDYPPLYYCAKASKAERDAGCEGMPEITREEFTGRDADSPGLVMPLRPKGGSSPYVGMGKPFHNHHPTVKSLALMRYLITLCTRPGATVLDPFVGSGTTGVAAVQLGRNFIGCDNETEYLEIAKRRIEAAMPVAVELPMFAEVDV